MLNVNRKIIMHILKSFTRETVCCVSHGVCPHTNNTQTHERNSCRTYKYFSQPRNWNWDLSNQCRMAWNKHKGSCSQAVWHPAPVCQLCWQCSQWTYRRKQQTSRNALCICCQPVVVVFHFLTTFLPYQFALVWQTGAGMKQPNRRDFSLCLFDVCTSHNTKL